MVAQGARGDHSGQIAREKVARELTEGVAVADEARGSRSRADRRRCRCGGRRGEQDDGVDMELPGKS